MTVENNVFGRKFVRNRASDEVCSEKTVNAEKYVPKSL